MEVCFAFSATGTDVDTTSKLIRNTIAEIINKYGTVKLHYLAIVFGNQAQTVISYRNQNLDAQTLVSYITRIRQPSGSPRLDVALQEAKKAFDEVPRRYNVVNCMMYLHETLHLCQGVI